MLGRIRSARQVRVVLFVAAVLGVGGSLGLHAEPVPGRAGITETATAAAGSKTLGTASAAHTCLLCMLYGSALSSSSLSIAHGNLPRVPGWAAGRTAPEVALLTPDRSVRAPPSLV